LKLALRAQNQCRATIETLSVVKNPPTATFVRQANIAAGHQQVNNGMVSALPGVPEFETCKPNFGEDRWPRLDTRAASAGKQR